MSDALTDGLNEMCRNMLRKSIASATPEEKKPRFFVRGNVTDDVWWYAGGPSVDDVMTGLRPVIADTLDTIKDGNGDPDDLDIEISLRMLSDAEVEALPDV